MSESWSESLLHLVASVWIVRVTLNFLIEDTVSDSLTIMNFFSHKHVPMRRFTFFILGEWFSFHILINNSTYTIGSFCFVLCMLYCQLLRSSFY